MVVKVFIFLCFFAAFFNAQGCDMLGPSVFSSKKHAGAGDVENFNITSPAATVALGLMYLQTNNKDVADVFLLGKWDYKYTTCL